MSRFQSLQARRFEARRGLAEATLGRKTYWHKDKARLTGTRNYMSHEQLDGRGSGIKFLRRRMIEVEDGLIFMPGTTVEKAVQALRLRLDMPEFRKLQAMPGFNLLTIHLS